MKKLARERNEAIRQLLGNDRAADLLYGNVGGVGDGAWLLCFPALF